MFDQITILMTTAVSIGFLHTILGPDHYLPFVAIAKARNWSGTKTCLVTVLCGLGHVLGSVILGLIGIAFGIAVYKLEAFESVRGDLAGWVLIAFGLVYFVWGLRRAYKKKLHGHLPEGENRKPITIWLLFIVFVLGPCEPLIPILMYPAAQFNFGGMVLVAIAFSVTTVVTMLGMVLLLRKGISFIPLARMERFSHALAGITILISGLMIQVGL